MGKKNKVMNLFLAIIAMLAFNTHYEIINIEQIRNITNDEGRLITVLYRFFLSYKNFQITYFLLTIAIGYFVYYSLNKFTYNKSEIWYLAFSLFISATYILGYSYFNNNNSLMLTCGGVQKVKSIIGLFGNTIITYFIIRYIRKYFSKFSIFQSKENFNSYIFDKFKFIGPFILCLILWIPMFIAYYPGIFMGDTWMQIRQFFNLPEATSNYLNLINPAVKLNNHHPVIHTLLMGGCVKLGKSLFNSVTVGYFIYTFIQCLFMAIIIAYAISILSKAKVKYWIRWVVLCFYCVFPIIYKFIFSGTKDIIFSGFLLLFIIKLYQVFINDNEETTKRDKIFNTIFISIICILICLFRPNGIFTVVITFFFIGIYKKKFRIPSILICISTLIVYFGINNIVYPLCQITNGSVREALSIPFQQTARYVKEYGNEVTHKEKKTIDRVLDYNKLESIYNPILSDPVKDTYNEKASKKDLIAYFKVWFSMFLKHPCVYASATINNYYGYFYIANNPLIGPTFKSSCAVMLKTNTDSKGKLDFHYADNKVSKKIRTVLDIEEGLVNNNPILSVFSTCAMYTLLLLYFAINSLAKKNYNLFIMYLPLVTILFALLAGPCNGVVEFRYVFPIAFCMPIVILIDKINTSRKEENF